MPIVIETLDEFKERHGRHVQYNGGLIFENGAMFKNGTQYDPSTDTKQLAEMKLLCAELMEKKLINSYNALREDIKVHADFFRANAGPPPTQQHFLALKELEQEILYWKAKRKVRKTIYDKLTNRVDPEKRQRVSNAQANQFNDRLRQFPNF